MTADKKSPKETSNASKEASTPPSRADNKVPEGAENMEHALRRLVREKDRERAKNPGLYR